MLSRLLAFSLGQRLLIVRVGALCTLASFALIFVDKSYAWLALVMALALLASSRLVAAGGSSAVDAFRDTGTESYADTDAVCGGKERGKRSHDHLHLSGQCA